MNRTKWNLDNPRDAEEVINFLYSLPENEILSEVEADSDAEDELNALEIQSNTSTPSTSREGSFYSTSPITADREIPCQFLDKTTGIQNDEFSTDERNTSEFL